MAKRKRESSVYFMVTPEERQLIEDNMRLVGTDNIGAYLRKMAIDGYVINLDLSEVRDMVKLLRNATNNLNQIARRANETGSIYEADIEDIRQHYEKLWQAANKILLELAKL